jgi:hypothetical protein
LLCVAILFLVRKQPVNFIGSKVMLEVDNSRQSLLQNEAVEDVTVRIQERRNVTVQVVKYE